MGYDSSITIPRLRLMLDIKQTFLLKSTLWNYGFKMSNFSLGKIGGISISFQSHSHNIRFLAKTRSLRHDVFDLTFFVLIPQIFPALKNCGLPQFLEGKICSKINKKSSESFNYYTNILKPFLCFGIKIHTFWIITLVIWTKECVSLRKFHHNRRFDGQLFSLHNSTIKSKSLSYSPKISADLNVYVRNPWNFCLAERQWWNFV